MNAGDVAMVALAVVAAGSALGILLIRNVFYAAMLLLLCLLAIAGIYLLLEAEFLAVTQIIIYAGGVAVLIIFGIMLTARLSGKAMNVLHQNYFAGTVAAILLFAVLVFGLSEFSFTTNVTAPSGIVRRIGLSLFTDYVAPFEIAGVLLLVSLIAAAVLASHKLNRPKL